MSASARGAAAALLAITAAAFALRVLDWQAVAVGGHVVLPLGDAAYHARRALWTAQHWPSLLLFDPLVGFPDGAFIPWPPLHTWLVAGLARALGGGTAAVERVALWLPPLQGALAALPVYAAAARLGGRTAGLGAAALLAALPAHVEATSAGHVGASGTVTLLAALWLAFALRAAAPGPARAAAIGVALARAGLLLAAPGGLAALAVADGAQLTVLASARRSRALAAHAAGLGASAGLVALAAPGLAPPAGVSWAAVTPSWLHVAAMGALALAAAALAAATRGRPDPGAHRFAPRAHPAAWVLALWTAGFGALALVRSTASGVELAAPAAVAVAAGMRAAWRALAGRPLARPALLLGLACAALPLAWPLARLLPPPPAGGGDPRLATAAGTLAVFAEQVRAATPETADFDDPGARPAWGLLAPPELGHPLLWGARRALVLDGFGPYARSRHFAEARGFASLESEAEAAALAERLGARFVVTAGAGGGSPRSLAVRLHDEDGLGRAGAPPWERFRLLAEAPPGGRALAERRDAPAEAGGASPYKLFEVVAGARIEALAPPGTRVAARLVLETPGGRRLRYRTATLAADDGVARLRVPYPGAGAPAPGAAATVRALGPWRVWIDGVAHDLAVAEDEVRTGAVVVVGGPD